MSEIFHQMRPKLAFTGLSPLNEKKAVIPRFQNYRKHQISSTQNHYRPSNQINRGY